LRVIHICNKIQVGFGLLDREPVIEISGYIPGAVEIPVRGGLTALGIVPEQRLDIMYRRAGIHRGKDHPLVGRIEIGIQYPEAVRELGAQVLVARRITDIIRRGGQRLQLRGRRLSRPAGIERPQVRGPGPQILKVHRRRKVYIVARHRDPLGGIVAVVVGELYTRSCRKIELLILYPPVHRKPVRMGDELIRIGEQAVQTAIPMGRIGKIIGIVQRRIVRVAVIIIEFQDLVLGYRFRIGQGRAERSAVIRIDKILIQRIDPPQLVKIIDGIVIARAVIDIGRNIHVQGNGPERLLELMPQLQVRPVDIESVCNAVRMSVRAVDRRAIVVYCIVGGGGVRIAVLECYIGPEDQRIIAVESRFQVGIYPVVLASRYTIAAASTCLDRIPIDRLDNAVLCEGRNMLLIVEIAGRKVGLGA